MLTVATWNVNSIKQRETAAVQWLKRARPDVLCLQEIKCQTEAFPRGVFEDLGYNCAVIGQKSFNGVAILSRFRSTKPSSACPATTRTSNRATSRRCCRSPAAAHFAWRLSTRRTATPWLRRSSITSSHGSPVSRTTPKRFSAYEEPFALAGDYNIIPRGIDVYNPASWTEDALFRLESRQAFRRILNLGLADAVETCNSGGGQFTFWDYQAGAWQKNLGLRIDHILLSPQALSRLRSATIDRTPRSWDKPSDHTPVQITLGM